MKHFTLLLSFLLTSFVGYAQSSELTALKNDIKNFWQQVKYSSMDDEMHITVNTSDQVEQILADLEENINSIDWLLKDIITNGCNFETCDLAANNLPNILYLNYLHLAVKTLDRISLQQGYKHHLLDTYRTKFLEHYMNTSYAD